MPLQDKIGYALKTTSGKSDAGLDETKLCRLHLLLCFDACKGGKVVGRKA